MKIIDNRYKNQKKLEDNIYYETYIVSDLWGDERHKLLKFYNYDEQKKQSTILLQILFKLQILDIVIYYLMRNSISSNQ